MSRWFRFHADMVWYVEIATLSNADFRRKLMEALEGGENEISPFIRGPYVRPLADEWQELRAAVFERDDYTCQYCGDRGKRLECDHVVPVARGGSSDIDNLTTACFACNRSKRSKTVEEWRAAQ